MSKYKVGDKFVVEIKEVMHEDDICYRTGMRGNGKYLDAEQLDELKKLDSDYINDNFGELQDEAYDAGMREAWGLALSLRYMDYDDKLQVFGLEHDGKDKWVEIMEKFTPQEAKAKIEAWEKSKEEIKVGDVVTATSNNKNYVVTGIKQDNNSTWYVLLSGKGLTINTKDCILTKTGRYIDIQSMLEQIGGKE